MQTSGLPPRLRMDIPFKFDLSNISGTAVAQILFPLVPGTVLVLGGAAIRPEIASAWFALPYIGYYTKLAVIVFSAYAVGLFLAMTVIGVIGGAAGFIASLLGNYLRQKWHGDPWNHKLWREVARQFIGEEFTPILDRPLAGEVLRMMVSSAETIEDMTVRMKEVSSILGENQKRVVSEFEWAEWYWILERWFPPPAQPGANVGTFISQAAYCSAVAVMILLHFGPYSHPLAWTVCYLTLFGGFLEYLFLYLNPLISDSPATRQTAAMMRYLLAKVNAKSEVAR
jgi:hypothetical protein